MVDTFAKNGIECSLIGESDGYRVGMDKLVFYMLNYS